MLILWTLLTAFTGSLIAIKLKIPVAPMVGAMVAVATCNIFTEKIYLPLEFKIVTQIISGAFIGAAITKWDVIAMKKIIKPACLALAIMISFGLVMGLLLHRLTTYNLPTTLFACAPGGVVDMSLISHDLGADSSIVAVLQLVRLLVALCIIPSVLKMVLHQANINKTAADPQKAPIQYPTWHNFAITIVIAAAGGLLGHWLGIPAGALIFAMIACAAQNIQYNNAFVPSRVKMLAQTGAGALIGEGVDYATILSLRQLLVPVLILIVSYVGLNLLLGFVLTKVSELDLQTALFATAPGGVADMALIAGDYGANMVQVTIIQTARMCGTIALYPLAITLIMSFS